MKNKALKIVNLILALFLALFSIGYVFAWFADGVTTQLNLNGSAGSYFAYGNGSAEQPFGITTPQHLYNLAWLNNTGRFGKTKYYFTVGTRTQNEDGRYTYTPVTIDMGDTVLPPIGTTANPFLGDFNGCGSIISNLKVSTDLDKITNPVSYNNGDVLYSSAVGMFGETASGATSYIQQDGTPANFDTTSTSQDDITARASDVHDFILQDPQIDVSGADSSSYADSIRYSTGIAIGYVSGNASNISVYNTGEQNTILNVARNTDSGTDIQYTTLNSIIGNAADNVGVSGIVPTTGNISVFIPENAVSSFPEFENGQWVVSSDGYAVGTENENRGDGGAILNSSSYLGLGNFSFIAKQDTSYRSGGNGELHGVKYAELNEPGEYEYTFGDNGKNISSELLTYSNNNSGYDEDAATSVTYYVNGDTSTAQKTITWKDIFIDEKGNGWEKAFTYSLRFTDGDDTVNDVKNLDVISENSSEGKGGVIAEDIWVENGDYSGLRVNAFRLLITENNASFTIAWHNDMTLYIEKIYSEDELETMMKNAGLPADINDFYIKNDYSLLKDTNETGETTLIYSVKYPARSGSNRSGWVQKFDLSSSVKTASGESCGPGLYLIRFTNNTDIHYLYAEGVAHGNLGQGSQNIYNVRNIDFIYDMNVPVSSDEGTAYRPTNAAIIFSSSVSDCSIILAFNRVGAGTYWLTATYEATGYSVRAASTGTGSVLASAITNTVAVPDWMN